ncbi:PMC1_1 [Sanghuangporus vaninii]
MRISQFPTSSPYLNKGSLVIGGVSKVPVKVAPEIKEIPAAKREAAKIEFNDDGTVILGSFPEKLTPQKLSQFAEAKDSDALEEFGRYLSGLCTNPKRGLSGSASEGKGAVGFVSSLEERRYVYGQKTIPGRKTKYFPELISKQRLLVLLTVAAIAALALGPFQDFGAARESFTRGRDGTCNIPKVKLCQLRQLLDVGLKVPRG